MATIKLPPVYDVSHWKVITDFSLINPKPVLMITKATEDIAFVDNKFVEYFNGISQIGVARGCYHFMRKGYNATTQAQHFCNTIRPYITEKDILILDMEEEGETAARIIEFLKYVQGQFTKNIVMLYSRKNLLDPITMTQAQKDYMNQIPVWTAGYPTTPDIYTTVPTFYVPDETKYGDVWLWQYASNGVVSGISGDVDLNWISPVFLGMIGGVIEPVPPINLPASFDVVMDAKDETGKIIKTYKGTLS